jgi:putative transposase
MARPLRIEYPGALYHITSRGDRQENIYLDDEDRETFLSVLGEVCSRFNWAVYAYCLMDNHYHLLIETPQANMARGMRQLNGVYTQRFNRRHKQVGHLFQGRYKAILVQKETYLLELSRYIVLNPVRAGVVKRVRQWRWSSYRSVIGESKASDWLETDWLLGQFGKKRGNAIEVYRRFVQDGIKQESIWKDLKHQILLGDDSFVGRLQRKKPAKALEEIPKRQRRSLGKSLEAYQKAYPDRDKAMATAYLSGAYSMKEIGKHFGVHYMTVSRAVRRHEDHHVGM